MRKILVIILFAVAGAFADALYSVGAGYSSLGRVEATVLNIRIGHSLYFGFSSLRFDIRTSYDEDEYDHPPVSLGAPIVTVPAILIGILENAREDIALLMISLAFLASGELGYQFLDYKPFKLSVFESHVFEWWLYKKQDKWHMDEAGWGQELGLELQFPHVLLSGGAQFEITNKRKGIGWFVRLNLVDLFALKK